MLIGYARVSSQDQQIELQRDALEKAGCKKLFTDIASGAKTERNGLEEALKFVRAGDTLVVWKLDRLGRSLKDLIERIGELQARGIGFKSVQENIDTTTANGILFFHIFGAIAQFERELIRERTLAGLQSARARGRLGGRPQALDERTRALACTTTRVMR
jgi:DNA invertase Pin-like site-specific DNA recombinase